MNILDEIADRTRERVAEQKASTPLGTIRRQAEDIMKAQADASTLNDHPFERALRDSRFGLICEVKKASPSKGIIEPDFHPLEIAIEYEDACADSISCLTEPYWFLGSDEYLSQIASTVSIPVLRKDFTIDEYMIYQAKALGASAVLLICSMLDDAQLSEFFDLSNELGLSALIEAHDASEIERALRIGARVIGVNNRNLKDFSVDIGNAAALRSQVPENVIFIAESGVTGPNDIAKLSEMGIESALIGEALMRSSDKRALIKEMRAAAGDAR